MGLISPPLRITASPLFLLLAGPVLAGPGAVHGDHSEKRAEGTDQSDLFVERAHEAGPAWDAIFLHWRHGWAVLTTVTRAEWVLGWQSVAAKG